MKKMIILGLFVFAAALLWAGIMTTVSAFEVDSLLASSYLAVASIIMMGTGFMSVFLAVDIHRN